MEFNNEQFKSFKEDFKKLNEALELKYNISIKLGNISYTANEFSTKMSVYKKIEGKEAEQLDYEKHCYKYGLKPEHYMKTFSFNGSEFKLKGIKPANRKYPIIAIKISEGVAYKLPTRAVENLN